MENLFFLPVFFVLVATALAVMLVLVRSRKRSAALQEIAESFKATELLDRGFSASFNDLPYSCSYFEGSKNNPSSVKLEAAHTSPGGFRLSPEKTTHRLFKTVGISEEVQTGDAEFDDSIYIESRFPDFAQTVLESPDLRKTVRIAFDAGFANITYRKGNLVLTKSPFKFEKETFESEINRALPILVDIHNAIGHASTRVAFPRGTEGTGITDKALYSSAGVFGALGVLSLIFGLIFYKPIEAEQLFGNTLAYSVPLSLFLFGVLLVKTRGTSSAHRVLSIGTLLILTGCLTLCYGGALLINGYYDPGPATQYDVKLLSKRISRNKNSKNYYFRVESWRADLRSVEISTNSFRYRKAKEMVSIIAITSRPGFLGYEWVVDHKIQE